MNIENWDMIKKRMEAFWNNEVLDRPIVIVQCNKDNNNPFSNARPWKNETIKDWYLNPECILERNLDKFEKTYYAGDAVPIIFPNTGVGALTKYLMPENLLDTHVHYANTVWYTPVLEDLDTFEIAFNEQNKAYQTELEIIKYLNEQSKGRYLVAQPDNCGCYDILGALRGNEQLMMDFLEDPEAVREAGNKVVDALIACETQMLAAAAESCDGGSAQGWMSTWSPGRHMQMQCDLSVMISHQMYEDFIVEELERVSNWLDHAIYHFDGIEQTRHLDLLLSIKKLNMIQWTHVDGQPSILENLHTVHRIQEAGKGILMGVGASDLDTVLNNTSPYGRFLHVGVKDPEEADAVVDYVTKHSFQKKLF